MRGVERWCEGKGWRREKAMRQHESARETEIEGVCEKRRENDRVMRKSGTKGE